MKLNTLTELLQYFGARSLRGLERQFNSDGRTQPVLLDHAKGELLIATGDVQGKAEHIVKTMRFPFAVSDLLGQIELDRQVAERMA